MKKERSSTYLTKDKSKKAVRAQHPHIFMTLMALAMMILAPSSVKGVTTNIDFGDAGRAHYFQYADPSKGYYANINMSSTDYNAIGNGAKIGNNISYKYGNTRSIDISRLAFAVNSNGEGNSYNGSAGFYLRRNGTSSGLYTGSWNNKLAILGLKPGNKVTINAEGPSETINGENVAQYAGGIKYIQSVHANTDGSTDIYNNDNAWVNTNTINITSMGDLIVQVNRGTYITSITIEEEIAEYTIRTNADNSTDFWFTAPGSLEVNDFAIPYMSVSFGSANDFLVVQGSSEDDYAAHMIQTTGEYAGTETLSTDPSSNFQPSAGNFYAFKPTGGGTVYVSGTLTGNRTHLFVYNLATNEWEWSNGNPYKETYTSGYFYFNVEKDKIYYICINNQDSSESSYAFHLHWFKFEPTFRLDALAKVVDLENDVINGSITLTQVHGAGSSSNITVKRCTANIDETSVNARIVDAGNGVGNLVIDEPTFASDKDNAGTIILDVKTGGGDATFVVTFPYHAAWGWDAATGRSHGHVWSFMDPRVSDSNIGNCKIRQSDGTYTTGTTSGILSIGQYKDNDGQGNGSQFYKETEKREWTFGWSIKDLNGNITDPMYKNVFDMEGDNADMIWETEGLWFDNATNLSCLYNENDAAVYEGGTPVQIEEWKTLNADPDRYVGLLADANKKSSFTIPGLKDGDRVLIFMKSGEKSGSDREAIFLNIEGARDAVGTEIDPTYLYGAGGTLWQHSRLEGCYHFIKKGDGDMKFYMVRGAICKLLSIRIYSGKRINTNGLLKGSITENGTTYDSPLLFMNEEGDETGKWGWYQLRFRGKGDQMKPEIVACSGNLKKETSFSGNNFELNANKTAVTIRSTIGEFGVFRLRLNQMDFIHTGIENQGYRYASDFCDRNFTVGYRETYNYPYTWDFTDIQEFTGSDIATEASKFVESTEDYEPKGMDISLWEDGYMMIGNPNDPDTFGEIFSQNKKDFGNQLYANESLIPETQGLWFYMDDNLAKHNGCFQITSEGLHFINTALSDDSHDPWWNYKMVVPSVPEDATVYLRMKRDTRVKDTDLKYSDNDGKNVLFLNTRFAWGREDKTSLSEDGEPYMVLENGSNYSFFNVDGTDDEYILAVKNTTGETNHLQFTLNGWTLKKIGVSLDEKKIGTTGYATESRERVIDHRLTSFFTGKPVEAYIGKMNSDHTLMALTQIDIMDSAPNEVANAGNLGKGCILYNNAGESVTDKTVSVFDDGTFNLFVPDMHLKDEATTLNTTGDGNSYDFKTNFAADNDLKACVPVIDPLPEEDNNMTRFILSARPYKKEDNANDWGSSTRPAVEDGKLVGFYHVNPKTGAHMQGHQAYVEIPNNALARIDITFDMFEDIDDGVATKVEGVENAGEGNGSYMTISGQRVNTPAQSGIYIKNGKKIVVK